MNANIEQMCNLFDVGIHAQPEIQLVGIGGGFTLSTMVFVEESEDFFSVSFWYQNPVAIDQCQGVHALFDCAHGVPCACQGFGGVIRWECLGVTAILWCLGDSSVVVLPGADKDGVCADVLSVWQAVAYSDRGHLALE